MSRLQAENVSKGNKDKKKSLQVQRSTRTVHAAQLAGSLPRMHKDVKTGGVWCHVTVMQHSGGAGE